MSELSNLNEILTVIKYEDAMIQQARNSCDSEYVQQIENAYEELKRNMNRYSLAVCRSVGSLRYDIALSKTKKIDPYIAGGVADAIGGVGLGVATAISAERRNAEIESRRIEAKEDVIKTEMSENSAQYEVERSFRNFIKIIEISPVMVRKYECILNIGVMERRKKESEQILRKQEEQRREQQTKTVAIVVAILTIPLVFIVKNALVCTLIVFAIAIIYGLYNIYS